VTRQADDPVRLLRSVANNVAEMESALASGDMNMGTCAANELVAVTTELLDGIDHNDLARDPELISTLRVYRNAALVFRGLADANGESDPTRGTLCTTLIDQGHNHLRTFIGRL
jgi:hypothetical protein